MYRQLKANLAYQRNLKPIYEILSLIEAELITIDLLSQPEIEEGDDVIESVFKRRVIKIDDKDMLVCSAEIAPKHDKVFLDALLLRRPFDGVFKSEAQNAFSVESFLENGKTRIKICFQLSHLWKKEEFDDEQLLVKLFSFKKPAVLELGQVKKTLPPLHPDVAARRRSSDTNVTASSPGLFNMPRRHSPAPASPSAIVIETQEIPLQTPVPAVKFKFPVEEEKAISQPQKKFSFLRRSTDKVMPCHLKKLQDKKQTVTQKKKPLSPVPMNHQNESKKAASKDPNAKYHMPCHRSRFFENVGKTTKKQLPPIQSKKDKREKVATPMILGR